MDAVISFLLYLTSRRLTRPQMSAPPPPPTWARKNPPSSPSHLLTTTPLGVEGEEQDVSALCALSGIGDS